MVSSMCRTIDPAERDRAARSPGASLALAHPRRRAGDGTLQPNDSPDRGRLFGAMELDAGGARF